MVTTTKKAGYHSTPPLRTISAPQSMLVRPRPYPGKLPVTGVLGKRHPCHAFSGVSLAIWPTAAPLGPIGMPGSRSVRGMA